MQSSICALIGCTPSATAIVFAGSCALAAAHVSWLESATASSTGARSSVESRSANASQKEPSTRTIRRRSSAVNLVGCEKSTVRIRCPARPPSSSTSSGRGTSGASGRVHLVGRRGRREHRGPRPPRRVGGRLEHRGLRPPRRVGGRLEHRNLRPPRRRGGVCGVGVILAHPIRRGDVFGGEPHLGVGGVACVAGRGLFELMVLRGLAHRGLPLTPAWRGRHARGWVAGDRPERGRAARHRRRRSGPTLRLSKVGGGGVTRDDLGDTQAELLIDDHHLAAGDWGAVDEQIHRFAGQPLQRDDRAGAQLQHLTDGHTGAADLHAQLHQDVAEATQVGAVPWPGAGGCSVPARLTRCACRAGGLGLLVELLVDDCIAHRVAPIGPSIRGTTRLRP